MIGLINLDVAGGILINSVHELNALCMLLTDEHRYKILKLVESNPSISQRELALALGISLGKVNFCLQALIEKGLIKATNFRNSKNKRAYMYLLTPRGIEEKASMTMRFLKEKINEYKRLSAEIKELRIEAKSINSTFYD
jgi:EPS-associated MarR family transcriptional regulator